MANSGDNVAKAKVEGGDEVSLTLELDSEERIASSALTGVGCRHFLNSLAELRAQLRGFLRSVPLPSGDDHVALLLKEVLLKARGEWAPPFTEDEICHCREVSTEKVSAAIVGGCHTASDVGRITSAGTSCGSCRPDIENLIAYRLKKN
jgi:bacterioferritin-associated ferredoxin